MNSRDRIHAVFKRKKSDKIPFDIGGTRKTGISVTALYHLRQCLGTEKPARLYDVYEGTAELDEALANMLNCDVGRIPQSLPLLDIECLRDLTKKSWKPYAMEDGTGVLTPKDFYPERELAGDLCLRDFQDRRFALLKRGGWQYELLTPGPGALEMTVEDVENALQKPNPAVVSLPKEAYWTALPTFVKSLTHTTKKALSYCAGPPLAFLGGLGAREPLRWLNYLETKPAEAEALLEKYYSLWMTQLESLFAVTGKALDVLILEENFTGITQNEAMEVVQKKILPFYARGIQEIRGRLGSQAAILWQAEGDITPVLPQLIEMGVQGISFPDLTESGMNPLAIKKQFGDALVLWGGACSATDLASLNIEALTQKMQENVATLNENGGYIHAISGNIKPTTAPEAILTFFGVQM